jgi:hypothetical protein
MSRRRKPKLQRKPAWELRPWSTYRSATEWYADYRGHASMEMAASLDQLVSANPGMTFPAAYLQLLEEGSIPHLGPAVDRSAVRKAVRPEPERGPRPVQVRKQPPVPVPTRVSAGSPAERPRFVAGPRLDQIPWGLVANRHPAVPRLVGDEWVCRTCEHGVNRAAREGGRPFWRHNPKTFSRREVPDFPY